MSALYTQSTLGEPDNQITFNDFTAKPVFRVQQTNPTKREMREQDVPIPGQSGVADYQTLEGKMYFLLDGVMFASNEAEYYAGRRLLRKVASLDLEQADAFADRGYVPYQWDEAGSPRQLQVKVEYVDGLGENVRTGMGRQPFRYVCKVKSPIIIDPRPASVLLGVTGQGTTTGNSMYSLLYPVAYGTTTYTGGTGPIGMIVNAGDISAYPTINIQGPVNVPRITNLATGEYIEVNVNLASSGDTLSIVYDADTAPSILQGGLNVYNKLTSGSTFFKVKPGANQLMFSGSTLSNGSQATVSCFSSWPLS